MFTNQLARSWAPELDLLGTVVGAPAAQLTKLYGPGDRLVPHVVELMGLFGIAADHPGTHPEAYLTPAADKHVDALKNGCQQQIIAAFAGLADHGLFAKDPITTEPAAALVRANDPGKVAAPSPILLFEGTDDLYVVPARAAATRKRLCSVGQTHGVPASPGCGPRHRDRHGTRPDLVVDRGPIRRPTRARQLPDERTAEPIELHPWRPMQ